MHGAVTTSECALPSVPAPWMLAHRVEVGRGLEGIRIEHGVLAAAGGRDRCGGLQGPELVEYLGLDMRVRAKPPESSSQATRRKKASGGESDMCVWCRDFRRGLAKAGQRKTDPILFF